MKQLPQILLLVLSLLSSTALFAQEDDKTLSPYFFVKSDSGSTDQLPLKATSADVNIAGTIANVTVSQVYQNDGKNTLEAVYVFPASTRAAVYGMTMTIGDRVIEAKIHEKKKAREAYDKAKAEGKSASLLEQERPNVFSMNVANIRPGEKIEVELSYTELLIPEEGVYEFVYPTVVGPRYTGGAPMIASAGTGTTAIAPGNSGFAASPYTKAGVKPLFTWDMNLKIDAGMPIGDITCGSHNAKVQYNGLNSATLVLDSAEKAGGNKDFVVQYSLTGNEIQSGVLLYEHGDENFFVCLVQPPKKVEPKHIPAREYVFIVDVSGSMRGWPLNISKKLLRNLIVNLKPEDKFNVVLFAGTSALMSTESLNATEENIEKAIKTIDSQRGGGGTSLLPALKTSLALPRAEEGVSRSFVVVTDGYVTVEHEAFELIRNNLDNANMYSFGIGSSVNRYLIEGIAKVGMSEPLVITSGEGADAAAEKFREYINSPVLTRVKVKFSGFEAYDVEPSSIPDVLAERPIVIMGKYKGEAAGKIKVVGHSGSGRYVESLDVANFKPSKDNSALRYLWARKRIELLDDYNHFGQTQEQITEVTNLGLKYNLMTAYTSFLAVDHKVSDPTAKSVKVKQPLPMPAGVSNSAVGFDLGLSGVTRHGKKSQERTLKPVSTADTSSMVISLQSLIDQKVRDIQKLAKQENISAKGKINLKLTVDASGSIISMKVLNSTLDAETQNWIIKQINNWILVGLHINPELTFELPITMKS